MQKVSVIMPIYNSEKFLKNTIQSVLDQTFVDFELILVNDGSTDSSLDICNSFDDSRIKIFTISNAGVSSARNFGLSRCFFERCCFIDSDDLYDKYYLETLMQYVSYDLVSCGIEYRKSSKIKHLNVSLNYDSKEEIATNMIEIINKGVINSPVTKLYKTKIIKDNQLEFNTKMRIGEDYNFNFRYLEKCNSFKCIPDSLYIYQVRLNSLSSRKFENTLVERKINIDLTEKYLRENNLSIEVINQMKLKLVYSYCMEKGITAKNIKENVYTCYFEGLRINGKAFKVMKFVYNLRNPYLLKVFAKLIFLINSKFNLKIKGASM